MPITCDLVAGTGAVIVAGATNEHVMNMTQTTETTEVTEEMTITQTTETTTEQNTVSQGQNVGATTVMLQKTGDRRQMGCGPKENTAVDVIASTEHIKMERQTNSVVKADEALITIDKTAEGRQPLDPTNDTSVKDRAKEKGKKVKKPHETAVTAQITTAQITNSHDVTGSHDGKDFHGSASSSSSSSSTSSESDSRRTDVGADGKPRKKRRHKKKRRSTPDGADSVKSVKGEMKKVKKVKISSDTHLKVVTPTPVKEKSKFCVLV